MEIIQTHVPNIPAMKTIFKVEVSTSTWQSISNFFAKYWAWLLGITFVGVMAYFILSPKKENKESDTTPKSIG